jgi:hypothetical protein
MLHDIYGFVTTFDLLDASKTDYYLELKNDKHKYYNPSSINLTPT